MMTILHFFFVFSAPLGVGRGGPGGCNKCLWVCVAYNNNTNRALQAWLVNFRPFFQKLKAGGEGGGL